MSLFPLLIFAGIGWLLYTLYFKKLMSQGKPGQIKLALIALGLVFLFMAVTGRAPALFAILGAAMTQVMRLAPLLIRFAPSLRKYVGGGSAAAGAGVSRVATATLIMTLDQATGAVDGEVIAGELQGRQLNSLTIDELQQLYRHCEANDAEALRLLQTYISREKAEAWQHATGSGTDEQNNAGGAMASAEMSAGEAMQVLGIDGDYTRKSVTAAHRSLMGRFHPDKGGNDYLATKLNTARDVLLDQLKKQA